MTGKVFISHSNADKELVDYVVRLVQAQGLTAYLAEHDVHAGQLLADKVVSNIRSSDAVVVLLTKQSIDSHYVQQEVGAARMAGRLVVPLVDPSIEHGAKGLLDGFEYILLDTNNPVTGTPDLVEQLRGIAEQAQLHDLLQGLLIAALVVGTVFVVYQVSMGGTDEPISTTT